MAEYIEREALLSHVKDLPTWWADDGGIYGEAMKYPDGMFDCEDIIASIENAPAADVASVAHGAWVFKFDGPYKRRKGYCSVCGQHSGIGGIQKNQEKPFCPNCGAKMDGEP